MKIAVVINVLPTYREGLYRKLIARPDVELDIYCHSHIPGVNMRTAHERFPHNVNLMKGVFFANGELVVSAMPLRKLLFGYDAVYIDGNPRYVTMALVATLMRVLRRKVVLWTMARSFRRVVLREKIRLAWSRIFDEILVYNDAEVDFLRKDGFRNQKIVAMNNGLDQDRINAVSAEWTSDRLGQFARDEGIEGRTLILACARLDPKNRFDLLVDALPALVEKHPDLLCCIIGGGVEREALEARIRTLGLEQRVRFAGEMFDEHRLAPWFLSASVFVHPAAIGLSLLHAFGYGLAVVTHSNAWAHGPEFCAFVDGAGGLAFEEGDVSDLATKVSAVLQDPAFRARARVHNLALVNTRYNVGVMADRFMSFVDDVQ